MLFRLALRDFRGGLRGFAIFLGCIGLGVAAIVGVGATSQAISDGLASQGRIILGGDISIAMAHRELPENARHFLEQQGELSSLGMIRAMARSNAGDAALVEIKAVDDHYPTLGQIEMAPAQTMQDALAEHDGKWGLVADPDLMARLNLKTGDALRIGEANFVLRASLVHEPDRLAAGIGFGPRVIVAQPALIASGLVRPGSLITWLYRLKLPSAAGTPAARGLNDTVRRIKAAFPKEGWEVRTRTNISPEFTDNLARFTQFLTLVGLTVLLVGGIGIANAVRAFVQSKQATLATFKSLGASGRTAFALVLVQVMIVAVIGTLIGIAVGLALPFLLNGLLTQVIPFPLEPHIHASQILVGLVYGLLTALTFAMLPLGRAHDVPVAALFRHAMHNGRGWPRPFYLALTLLAGGALLATILLLSQDVRLALWFMGLVIGGALMLRGIAALIMLAAAKMPHIRRVHWRLAIANLHRPDALTPAMVLSLGLGLSLLVAIMQIDGNIRHQLSRGTSGKTPSFFFLDIQSLQAAEFDQFLQAHASGAKIAQVPLLRGRIIKLNGLDAEKVPASNPDAWVLRGDRGITFASAMPKGSVLTEGQWWGPDVQGQPQVSFDDKIGKTLGLKLHDTVSVNVLGRELTAQVTSFRKVQWQNMGMNFVMIFSPNTFAGAPYSQLASLTYAAPARPGEELTLLKDVAQKWPEVTTIRVKDALDSVKQVVGQLAFAIRGVSIIALVSAILVLAGAAASGQQARLYDAVVLKMLGMKRRHLLTTFLIEFLALGLITAIFGLSLGIFTARLVVIYVMKLDFFLLWGTALGSAFLAMLLVLVLGLASTWRILGQKPAGALRELG